jgi:hypothetical protein
MASSRWRLASSAAFTGRAAAAACEAVTMELAGETEAGSSPSGCKKQPLQLRSMAGCLLVRLLPLLLGQLNLLRDRIRLSLRTSVVVEAASGPAILSGGSRSWSSEAAALGFLDFFVVFGAASAFFADCGAASGATRRRARAGQGHPNNTKNEALVRKVSTAARFNSLGQCPERADHENTASSPNAGKSDSSLCRPNQDHILKTPFFFKKKEKG